MDRGELFRRSFHCAAPAFLAYYLVPCDMWGLVDKRVFLLFVLAFVLAFEAARLKARWRFFGLREYEAGRAGAYAWAGAGLAIGFLLFPMPLVAATLFAMAWVDPLISVLRRSRPEYYPAAPLAVWMAIVLVVLVWLSPYDIGISLALAGISAVVALFVEAPKIYWLDDDFLLLTVPLLAMWLVLVVMMGHI